jgi:ABC-type sugar transport system substrate-binding protein
MKKILAIAMVLMFSLTGFTACSGTARKAAKTAEKFTLVLPMGANAVWNDCADGFKAACKKAGVEATVLSPVKPNDVNEMNALVETAIASGTNGIITQSVNPDGQAPVFAELDKAKIPYCLVNSDAPNSNRLAFIGTGDSLGIVGGKAIVAAMNGKKIILGTALFNLTAPIAISLHNAYLSELKKNPGGFQEVAVLNTQSDQLISVQEWTNTLIAHPDINAGINICGFGGLGAAKAMNELGLKGKITMMAIDFVPETLDGIRDGTLFGTMTQNFYRMGYQSVIWIKDFNTTGKKPANVINDSGTVLVTKDNIDTFTADMKNPAKWVE